MPRPSLERTLKYIPVVPRAQSKLGREARRGSHDLRKLVGHANFLDTLMEKLDLDATADEEIASEPEFVEPEASNTRFIADEAGHISWANIDFGDDDQWETDDSDSSRDDDDELVTPEFDLENDDEHTLGRTQSRRDGVPTVESPVHAVPIVTPEAQHPTSVAAKELTGDEAVDNVNQVDKQIQMPTLELPDRTEDYFSDKNLPHQRAHVAASLASFDVGTTVSAVKDGA